MVWFCCVPRCSNKFRKGLSFHSFPTNLIIQKQWIRNIRRDVGKLFQIKSKKVCGAHFLPQDYKPLLHSKNKHLKPEAVPTIFSWTVTQNDQQNLEMSPRSEMEEYILPENIKTEPTDESEPIVKSECNDKSSEKYILPDIVDNLDIKAEPKEELCVVEVTTPSLIEDRVSSNVVNTCASFDSDSYSSFTDFRTKFEDTDFGDSIKSNYANSQTCSDTKWASDQNQVYCVTPSASTCDKSQEEDNLASEDSSNEDVQLVSVKEVDIEEQTTDTISKVPMDDTDSSEEESDDEARQATNSDPEYCIKEKFPKNSEEEAQIPRSSDFEVFDTKSGALHSELNIRKTSKSRKYRSEKDFKYDLCNYTSAKKWALNIQSKIHSKQDKCDLCNYACILKGDLIQRARSHSGEKPLKCKQSDFQCAQRSALYNYSGLTPHKCDLCHLSSLHKHDLTLHTMTHSDEKPFKCKLCDYTCAQETYLHSHEKIHSDLRPYKCDLCGFSSNNKSYLRKHVRNHTCEKPFKCDHCDFRCKWKSKLDNHKKIHSSVKPYKCEQCNYTCVSKVSLKNHMDNKHFKCSLCDFKTNIKWKLFEHEKIHSSLNQYKCDQCEYTCARKKFLKYHAITHINNNYFKCNLCDYICLNKWVLNEHEKIHSSTKPFKCEQCDYTCVSENYLKCHVWTHVNRVKSFKCKVCEYKCASKDNLIVHALIHSSKKPFKCKQCDYTCARKYYIYKHEIIHSELKPYKCDLCDFSCKHKHSLEEHVRIHSSEKSFKCDHCDFRCKRKGTLYKHRKIHSTLKPLKCEKCNYTCNSKLHLKRHVKTHSDKKPFKCNLCEYKCAKKGNLKQHFRVHIGKA